jgi:hypothetical protein
MVVIVLVLVWLVVILPIAVRKLSEFQLVSSVARFHHQTELLERAHASFVGVHTRLPVARGKAPPPDDAQMAIVRAIQARIDARRTRRREMLLLLGSGICSTLLVGAVPSLRAFWVVAVLLATVTGVYLSLLVRCAASDAAAAERARKVVAITTGADEIEPPQEHRVAVMGRGGFVDVPQAFDPRVPRFVVSDEVG